MSLTTDAPLPLTHALEANLVCGAGGSRAILGSAGAIIACHLAGIENWRSIGGASGGSIPTVLLAGGVHPVRVLRLLIETDFASKLTRHASPLRILLTYFLKDNYYRIVRPQRGLFSSEKLGEYVESHVPAWPENYWTVAAWGSSQILFNADGVFEYRPDGKCSLISSKPAPLGLAIRATCAIPGVFDAVLYRGMSLCDGALSIDGRTPVGAVKRHLGLHAEKILAVDVALARSDRPAVVQAIQDFLWRLVCGKHCPQEDGKPCGSEGVLLIKPEGMRIRYLQFHLTADEKWHTVMCGFRTAVDVLQGAGLMEGARLARGCEIVKSFDEFVTTSSLPGELAQRTEALLAGHGLY